MRRVVAVIFLVAAGCGISTAGTGTVSAAPSARAVAIGDSVMLGAQPQLQRDGIVVYAQESRAFIAGLGVAQTLRASGGLGRSVVIHLGTNGPITDALFNEMMLTLRGVPRVYFLTVKEPRFWESQVNATLRNGVRRWTQARLVDWNRAATAHPYWLTADGIHLTPAGAAGYAALVSGAVR